MMCPCTENNYQIRIQMMEGSFAFDDLMNDLSLALEMAIFSGLPDWGEIPRWNCRGWVALSDCSIGVNFSRWLQLALCLSYTSLRLSESKSSSILHIIYVHREASREHLFTEYQEATSSHQGCQSNKECILPPIPAGDRWQKKALPRMCKDHLQMIV